MSVNMRMLVYNSALPEAGPGLGKPFLLGKTCRLAARECPWVGLLELLRGEPCIGSSSARFPPIETIEMDRRFSWVGVCCEGPLLGCWGTK